MDCYCSKYKSKGKILNFQNKNLGEIIDYLQS